ncbi:sodium-coupled monocarboxylate transporter 1 isoform X2 [Leptinotarsa decemlineata]|uniref:sodium-coupled monocarboxylate transporter 1 isoform X2 n=1 Tax=Leptinotarsa decemlineata TaxID=7539 RepID=UPI003D306D46
MNLTTSTITSAPELTATVERFFSWYDYAIFSTMLSISGGMGIYFGCFGQKQTTAKEYLLGGREMKVFPIVMSLIASHTSGVTLLALPSEIYVYGAAYWFCAISLMIVAVVTIYVYLPVFYKLQLTSTYEYIGLRFNERLRKFASILYAISVFLYIPIVIYIPALAFSSATGVDVHIITPIVCGICIFYTTIGGLKALVWTDTLQFSLTVAALLFISFLGFRANGGVGEVFKKSYEGGRLDVWETVIFYFLGMIVVKSLCVLTGLNIYAKYSQCDPLSSHKIHKNDEILPYYVLDVGGSIPGLSGLFIAGVFCASLSTLSGSLNCLAGTIYEDFLKISLKKKGFSNASALKILVVIIGTLGTLMVYIVEHLGGLLALAIGLGSVAHGPLLGIFTLGVLFPRANAKGALIGAIVSAICMATIIGGNSYYKANGLLRYPHKPVSVEECDFSGNTTSFSSIPTETYIFPVFKISFYWFSMIGASICMIVGLAISYMSEEKQPPVAKELLSPIIYGLIDQEKYINKMNLDYCSVEDAAGKHDSRRRMSSKWEAMREERLRKISKLSTLSDNIDI